GTEAAEQPRVDLPAVHRGLHGGVVAAPGLLARERVSSRIGSGLEASVGGSRWLAVELGQKLEVAVVVGVDGTRRAVVGLPAGPSRSRADRPEVANIRWMIAQNHVVHGLVSYRAGAGWAHPLPLVLGVTAGRRGLAGWRRGRRCRSPSPAAGC